MPLKHSPPRAPANLLPLSHCKSDSDITSPPAKTLVVPEISGQHAKSDPNIAARKRKRDKEEKQEDSRGLNKKDVLEIFSLFKKEQEGIFAALLKEQNDKHCSLMKEQNEKFTALMKKVQSGINSHTEQNTNISNSIEFLSHKYDEMALRINTLEQEKIASRAYTQSLETRLEQMDRSLRSSSMEIRNVPKKTNETKDDLLKILKQVGSALNVPVQSAEIRDVYRINSKNEKNQPIVVELSTVSLRDTIIGSVKAHNKKFTASKFSTSDLKLEGPPKPVFVSESLTVQTKKLFFLAREFAKSNGLKYCWSSRGKIYLRRAEGASLIRVNGEEDLENLKTKD